MNKIQTNMSFLGVSLPHRQGRSTASVSLSAHWWWLSQNTALQSWVSKTNSQIAHYHTIPQRVWVAYSARSQTQGHHTVAEALTLRLRPHTKRPKNVKYEDTTTLTLLIYSILTLNHQTHFFDQLYKILQTIA